VTAMLARPVRVTFSTPAVTAPCIAATPVTADAGAAAPSFAVPATPSTSAVRAPAAAPVAVVPAPAVAPAAASSIVKVVNLGSLQVAPANKENSCSESPARRASASPVVSKVLTPNGNSPCRYRHQLHRSADWQAGLEAALAIQALHAGRGMGA